VRCVQVQEHERAWQQQQTGVDQRSKQRAAGGAHVQPSTGCPLAVGTSLLGGLVNPSSHTPHTWLYATSRSSRM
jgi:hypothetical protein